MISKRVSTLSLIAHNLRSRLRESFIEQLGLTNEEIAALFDAEERPLDESTTR